MEYLVSIVVPVYNVEPYLDRCVKSIVEQTYRPIEIILVDDGSTDLSGSMCDKWSQKDPRIKVIHKVNGGLSDARNVGIDSAKGEFISFIDSDDYIALDMIESTLTRMVENRCEIGICNMISFDENGNESVFYAPTDELTIWKGNEKYKTLSQPSVCNKIFNIRLFDGVDFPRGRYYEDTFVYHELLYKSSGTVLTGKTGYFYLKRSDSIIGQFRCDDRYFDFVHAVWERTKFLQEHQIYPYTYEACLGLYAAYSNCIDSFSKNSEYHEKLRIAKMEYTYAYATLMKDHVPIGFKQRVRLYLLKFFPSLHRFVYSKRYH